MADSKLEPIYDRLHGVPQYHPVNAETFADWAMEAGDVVTVSRNGEAHSAPVHSSTLRWRGKQQITINSEGAREREAIAKMAKKKYGRGGSGVRNSAQMYNYEVNQEHLLYEVYDTQGRVSTLTVNVRGLYHEVYDTDGKFSTLQNTANGLYHEVYDTDGKFSKLQNTANGLYHEVYDTDGKFSTLQNTANGLYHEVYDTDGKFSTLQNTANGLYHEVYDTDGKFSTLQNTANGLYHEVYDTDGKFSTLQNTANGLYHEVYDTNGKFSTLQNTVNGLYHEVYDTNGKFSTLQNTANGLYHEVYDTNGKFNTLQNTADGLYHEVYDDGTGLKTVVETQAGQLNMVVSGTGSNTKIKPAAIQASIDSATGTSKISLSADHVELDGDVIVNGLSSTDDIDCGSITSHGTGTFDSLVVEAGGTISAPSITVTEFNDKDAESFIALSEITEGNDTWTLTDVGGGTTTIVKSGNDLIFTDSEGNTFTFSKATPISGLTGSWSGSTLTIETSPDTGNTYTVGFSGVYDTALYVSADGSREVTKSGKTLTAPVKVYTVPSTAPYTPQTRYESTIAVDASTVWDDGYDAALIKLDWASGTMTASKVTSGASANPQKLGAGNPSWSGNTATVNVYAYTSNSQLIGDTGFAVSVDASARYEAGQNSVTPTAISWQSSGNYFESHNPNDPTKSVSEDVQLIWESQTNSGVTVYYATLQSKAHSDSAWNNRIRNAYKLGLSGTTVQVQNSSGTRITNTPTYSIPLESKSITGNGSYTPGSGNVGFSSVTVSVPQPTGGVTVGSAISGKTYGCEISMSAGNPVSGSVNLSNFYTSSEYTTYGNTRSPSGSMDIGSWVTGSTYNITIYRNDQTYVNSTKDFASIYRAARNGYYKWIDYASSGGSSHNGFFAPGRFVVLTDQDSVATQETWWVPSAGFVYSASQGSQHQGDIVWDSTKPYLSLVYYVKDQYGNVTTQDYGITWKLYQSGGNPYPITKTMTCTGATFTQGQWRYTFAIILNDANVFTNGQQYKFHHNSSFT